MLPGAPLLSTQSSTRRIRSSPGRARRQAHAPCSPIKVSIDASTRSATPPTGPFSIHDSKTSRYRIDPHIRVYQRHCAAWRCGHELRSLLHVDEQPSSPLCRSAGLFAQASSAYLVWCAPPLPTVHRLSKEAGGLPAQHTPRTTAVHIGKLSY